MGFKPQKKVYTLKFKKPELEGLVVKARGTTIGNVLAITGEEFDVAAVKEAFQTFASSLVEWNILDDDDQPLPATYDGLLTLPNDFMVDVISAWIDAMIEVESPLEKKSNGTPPSLVASIPMETSTESP